MSILALLESGGTELISSEALLFEIERGQDDARREYAVEVLSRARAFVRLNERAEKRAARFVAVGIKPLDALHLALAEEAQADFFCTCDDRLLQKAKAMTDLKIRPVSPIELIEELEQ